MFTGKRETNQLVAEAHLGHHGVVILQRFLVFFKLGLFKLDFIFCTLRSSFLAFFLFFVDDRTLKRKQNKARQKATTQQNTFNTTPSGNNNNNNNNNNNRNKQTNCKRVFAVLLFLWVEKAYAVNVSLDCNG